MLQSVTQAQIVHFFDVIEATRSSVWISFLSILCTCKGEAMAANQYPQSFPLQMRCLIVTRYAIAQQLAHRPLLKLRKGRDVVAIDIEEGENIFIDVATLSADKTQYVCQVSKTFGNYKRRLILLRLSLCSENCVLADMQPVFL